MGLFRFSLMFLGLIRLSAVIYNRSSYNSYKHMDRNRAVQVSRRIFFWGDSEEVEPWYTYPGITGMHGLLDNKIGFVGDSKAFLMIPSCNPSLTNGHIAHVA